MGTAAVVVVVVEGGRSGPARNICAPSRWWDMVRCLRMLPAETSHRLFDIVDYIVLMLYCTLCFRTRLISTRYRCGT